MLLSWYYNFCSALFRCLMLTCSTVFSCFVMQQRFRNGKGGFMTFSAVQSFQPLCFTKRWFWTLLKPDMGQLRKSPAGFSGRAPSGGRGQIPPKRESGAEPPEAEQVVMIIRHFGW